MRPSALTPLLRRWPLPAVAALIALAALVSLLAGPGPAQAHGGHDGAEGHVHLEPAEGTTAGCATCPDAPTGWAEPGPDPGQITVHWTPATTGGTAARWVVEHQESGTEFPSSFEVGAASVATRFRSDAGRKVRRVSRRTALAPD